MPDHTSLNPAAAEQSSAHPEWEATDYAVDYARRFFDQNPENLTEIRAPVQEDAERACPHCYRATLVPRPLPRLAARFAGPGGLLGIEAERWHCKQCNRTAWLRPRRAELAPARAQVDRQVERRLEGLKTEPAALTMWKPVPVRQRSGEGSDLV